MNPGRRQRKRLRRAQRKLKKARRASTRLQDSGFLNDGQTLVITAPGSRRPITRVREATGQGWVDEITGQPLPADFDARAHRELDALRALLRGGGTLAEAPARARAGAIGQRLAALGGKVALLLGLIVVADENAREVKSLAQAWADAGLWP